MKNKIFLFILLGLFLISGVSAALTDGLVSYYTLNETSGNVIDATGNYNSSVYGTTARGQAGKIGTSYAWGGQNGNQTVIPTTFGITNTIPTSTVNAWAYLSGTSLGGAFFHIGNGDTGFGCGVGNTAYSNTGNNALCIFQNVRYFGSGTLGTGWVMVTLRIWSSGVPELFINGTSVGNFTGTNMSAMATQISTFGNLANQTNQGFEGSVDEIGVWNRTLTNAEITALYNSGSGKTYPFTDTATMYSSSISDNSSTIQPKQNQSITHKAYWQTNATSLSTYIFSWNNSGSWENLSTTEFSSNWSNVTTNITAVKDSNIGWWIWANDSEGKVNYTSIQEYLVRNSLPTSSIGMFNETGIIYNGTPVQVNVSIGDLDGLADIDMVIATIQKNISIIGTTNTTPLNYAYSEYNPIFGDTSQYAIEVSSIYEESLLHQVVGQYDSASGKRFFVYHNSTNGINFSTAVNITDFDVFNAGGQGYGLSYILKVGDLYYMFTGNFTKAEANVELDVFSSPNLIDWSLNCTGITTGGYKKNPAVWYNESDGVWHGLFEQGSGTFTVYYWNSTDLCSTWNKYSQQFGTNAGNADIKFNEDTGQFIVYYGDMSGGSNNMNISVAKGTDLNALSMLGKFVVNTNGDSWVGTHVSNPDVVLTPELEHKYFVYYSGNDQKLGVAYDSTNRTFEEAHFGTTTGYDENLTLSQVGSTSEWSGTFTNTSYVGLYNLTKIYVNDTDNGLNVSSYSTISFTTESDELNDTTATLRGVFKLNEGSGNTIYDSLQNLPNGLKSGATWITDGVLNTLTSGVDYTVDLVTGLLTIINSDYLYEYLFVDYDYNKVFGFHVSILNVIAGFLMIVVLGVGIIYVVKYFKNIKEYE